MSEFRGGDVNAVLRLVKQLGADGDAQLSVLTIALVVACRSCGVSKDEAIPIIEGAFDAEHQIVLLDSAAALGS
jgi:tellurite resistance protein